MLARPSPAKMRGGETLVQDAANYSKFDAPYRFNAKELDQEPSEGSSRTPLKNKTKREQTGNYYYGAPSRRDFEHKPTRRSAMLARPSHAFQREYYNPTWSVWLSVDPLSSQSPSQTPYHFASNNPIMRVDPDGLTDLENSETGEIVTVNDGMNQTVLIEANNWGEAVDFSHLEDGNNPSSAYNSFISNSGGVSVPTETSGGMIPNKEMFLGFMEFKIKNEEKEVAAFKAKDGSGYHFGPWKGNKTDSFNSTALVEDYASSIGYGKDDISEIHHTHPNGLANPSLSDAYLSYQLGGTPVFSMGESPFNKNLIEIHKATPRYFTQSEREYLKHRPLPMNLNLYGKKVDY